MSTAEIQKKPSEAAEQQQPPQGQQQRNWRRPHYDVAENAEAFAIRVNLPGVAKSGVDISVDGESLRITGTRTVRAGEGWRLLRRELPDADYRLELRLNVPINESKIKASVEAGVLELTLPKADEVKPRKIAIN